MNRRRVSISGFLLSFFPLLYDFSPERCRSVRKSTNVAVPCVGAFCFMAILGLCGFTCRTTRPATSGGPIFRCTFLPAALLFQRPPGAPSFVARRKIGEKGVSRGCGPLNPRGNVLGHSDVLCANHFATVRLTRLRRRKLRILRFRLWPKSSVATLLLLSPPNPLRWASAGAPIFRRRSALLPCALRAAPRR